MITVLTSGASLGVHVVGVLLARRLREAGAAASVEVLERWTGPAAGEGGVDRLLHRWASEGRGRFVALCGSWVPVLDRYATGVRSVAVDLCHVDAAPTPTFRRWAPQAFPFRHVWLIDAAAGGVTETIPVGLAPPAPWSRRAARCVAHAGGGRLGAGAERARALETWGMEVDVVAARRADLDGTRRTGRDYLIDPRWRPGEDDGLPPFGRVAADGSVLFRRSDRHHVTYELARRARAIVGPPTGPTLLDSLTAATPAVLLDGAGPHEARNGELWRRLGFGVGYDDWWRRGCSVELLRELHGNLLAARPGIASYPAALLTR
jgi:hypothetical protein